MAAALLRWGNEIMRQTWIVVAAVAAIAVAAMTIVNKGHIAPANAEEATIKRTELMNVTLGVADGLDGVMVISELPPGGIAPRHTHPADELSYVLEGAIELEIDGAEPVVYAAGETYHIPPGVVHAARNPSDSETTRILVFWTAEAGQPLTTPAP
jgi:quercetin dioxygenase-like cupin family protein